MQHDVSTSPLQQPDAPPSLPNKRGLWWSVLAIAAVASGATWWTVEAANDLPADTARHANELSKAFRYAAEKVTPTVVKITTVSRAKNTQSMTFRGNPFEGTPFEDYFKDDDAFRGFRQLPAPRAQQGLGSGVIIDPSGIILTNNHVVNGADEVYVHLNDGREFRATDIRVDPQTDLAVLRIEGAGRLPAAELGRSEELEIGDWVIAIGHPFSLDTTVSAGIISGKGRGLASVSRAQFLQTVPPSTRATRAVRWSTSTAK
jgi:Trypsin-like serine proteases, typically periplasmic, contain C-terminal PDZ domain